MTRLPLPRDCAACLVAAGLLILAALAAAGWQADCLVGTHHTAPVAVTAGWLALGSAALILSRVRVPGRSPDSAAPARKARIR